jgi:hypothetical protein
MPAITAPPRSRLRLPFFHPFNIRAIVYRSLEREPSLILSNHPIFARLATSIYPSISSHHHHHHHDFKLFVQKILLTA